MSLMILHSLGCPFSENIWSTKTPRLDHFTNITLKSNLTLHSSANLISIRPAYLFLYNCPYKGETPY